jgi:YVTN family beta-propeller protein
MNISGHVVVNSTLNISGSDLVINPKIKVLHIVDSTIENKVTTIYLNKGYIDEIYVQDLPRGMAIDPNSAILYVVNHNSHTVSVIDEYTNDIIANVNVGTFPTGIAINPKTNKIYVANEHSNTVSVIDSSINSVVNNITVGDFPTGIAINPKTNKIYVVNTDSDTVSVIDGNTDKALVGAIFNINPPNSGRLICNSKEIVNTTYIRYAVGANVKCEAKANGGFVLSSWSGDMASNLEDKPETKFKALQFGNLTANFIAAPPPIQFTIPTETLIQILLIIVTAIVGWLIPSIVGWINKARQKNSIVTFMENINNADNIHSLEELRKKVSEQYAKGKISESNYDILNNRISYYIESHNKKSQTDIRNDTNRIKKYTSEGKPA